MFTNFTVISPTVEQSPEPNATSVSSSRPRRQQVSRACAWCRTQRIKCDPHFPCTNCKTRGRKCSNGHTHGTGSEEVRTYPLAIKEIEKLRLRVKELERQLSDASITDGTINEENSDRPHPSFLPLNLDPLKQHGGNRKFYNWDFVRTPTSQSDDQCYGYSSSVYFTHQIASYLESIFQNRHPNIPKLPGNRHLARLVSMGQNDQARNTMMPQPPNDCTVLSQFQEEQLIETYFTSYQAALPIIDEMEFKTSHKCLWETLDSYRRPSALVDIVMALAMQSSGDSSSCYTQTLMENCSDTVNSSVTGQSFYRSCRARLADELETPSIQTFQSHLLSAVWLLNASYWNMAHSVLAMGIRTGIILGLHLEPPGDLNVSQKEFRRRLWWAMYSLEIRMAMDLGRPLAVSIMMVTVNLPNDVSVPLDSSGSLDSRLYTVEMTSYLDYYIRLILATRATYITFYRKCANVLSQGSHANLYHDHSVLESCAEFLKSKITYLQSWLENTPSILKTARKHGESFSTDNSALEFDLTMPSWISRQRVFLELEYHDLLMILYRPFISFTKHDDSSIPLTSAHAAACASHATQITSIIYQTINETHYLHRWPPVFAWQWNAFLSLIGYILAFPESSQSTSARGAVSTAIKTLELLPSQLEGDFTAADVARDLLAKADLLVERFRRNSVSSGHTPSSLPAILPFDQSENGQFDDLLTATDSTLSGFLQDGDMNLDQFIMPTNFSGSPLPFDIQAGLETFGGDATSGWDFSDTGNIDTI